MSAAVIPFEPRVEPAEAPDRDLRGEEEIRPPFTLVIFGASGDLTRRLLAPAIAHLLRDGSVSPEFAIIGLARSEMSDAEFRAYLDGGAREFTPPTQGRPGELPSIVQYIAGDFGDAGLYERLKAAIDAIEGKRGGPKNRIFYLATPPEADPAIVNLLGEKGLARPEGGWARVVVEKPFGHDLQSGKELNDELRTVFQERQIYRIDHYLGKETVQNIFVLRFANGVFEPLWNNRYIDHVQIAVSETIGVGHRAGYYDSAGVVRDMFQNHLLQLLCLTAMEPPVAFEADAVRAEKVKVLQSIRPIPENAIDEWAVRGQYGPGVVEGKKVPGYREEEKVNPQSNTPTYAAVKFAIDNWRWAGVPFYVRSGKRLAERVSEIAIEFKRVPHPLFSKAAGTLNPNVLRLRIQPGEGVSLKFDAKIPGTVMQVQSVYMDFPYSKLGAPIQGGYERLLLDVTHGDQTLFTRGDEVEQAWRVVSPILKAWEGHAPGDFPNYASGTWGPESADRFLEREGRRWRTL
ncbi:MAG TPA: glucose-6-phosphate dehydrogenase [Thermoanaerobaculia bacterium]|nr:glucose-6-phosphate dehydrogenase [Thermoanaerobaculia bacterium]